MMMRRRGKKKTRMTTGIEQNEDEDKDNYWSQKIVIRRRNSMESRLVLRRLF